jgi:hypothetical protein
LSADVSLAIGDRGAASFALAFAVTQLVEVPIYLRALRGDARGAGARSLGVRMVIAFGASAITHPIVWFVMPSAVMALYGAALREGAPALGEVGRTLLYGTVAEGFAVLAEALYLRGLGVRRALAWSLGANAASVIVGTVVVRLLL